VKTQKEELIELRTIKIESQNKITVLDERLRHLVCDLDIKKENIKINDNKIVQLTEQIGQKDYELKSHEQKLSSLRLQNQQHESTINGLLLEKKHLELSCAENKAMKEQYLKKSEDVQKKYEDCFDQLNTILTDKCAIDEIKKDRDERINKLREEFDELNTKHDELVREHSSLKVKHSHLSEEFELLTKDFATLSQ